jgi:hypothetical protein
MFLPLAGLPHFVKREFIKFDNFLKKMHLLAKNEDPLICVVKTSKYLYGYLYQNIFGEVSCLVPRWPFLQVSL